MQLCANLSMLWSELPMPARFAAAVEAGFDAVEIQFPDEHDLAALVAAQRAAGIPVVLVNVPRGSEQTMGLAAIPGAEAAFRAAVETARRTAEALGAQKVNVLAGRPGKAAPDACHRTLAGNLRHAAEVFARDGRRVLVEPLNPVDVPGFFLDSLSAGMAALATADHANLALQFDLYHMAMTEPDLPAAISLAGARIGHVQFADAPGRHEPGSGDIDFAAALHALAGAGYGDVLAAEYRPATTTGAGLGWMPGFRALMAGAWPGPAGH